MPKSRKMTQCEKEATTSDDSSTSTQASSSSSSSSNRAAAKTPPTSKTRTMTDDLAEAHERAVRSKATNSAAVAGENSIYIAHITLSLDAKSPPATTTGPASSSSTSAVSRAEQPIYPTWRYITVRRNPFANSIYNFRYK